MNEKPPIAEWHERLLQAALEWKKTHPYFRFSLRTSDPPGRVRLSRGYWFQGGEHYVYFPPFRVNDPHNKTKSIGFAVAFNRAGQPKRAALEVVFNSVQDEAIRAVHQEIVDQLGPFQQRGDGDKYRRTYRHTDPMAAFSEFLEADYPRIRNIIEQSGRQNDFLFSDAEFEEMLQRVEQYRTASVGSDRRAENGHKAEADAPRNLILYGPPGTGKTYWLTQRFREYTDAAEQISSDEWLKQTVAAYGWRPVIAAALADLGGSARVPEIRDHSWVAAKARERGRDRNTLQTIWGFLQEHTPPEVEIVKAATRRAPFIFTRSADSIWSLREDWRDLDPDAANLQGILKPGLSQDHGEEVRRYRVVTFHPSFTYEDFVRGIRPVVNEETGTTEFQMVDGVFKQICDEAREYPGKRYALFIDEINRANIAKVFGELITLVEADKRAVYDASGRPIGGLTVHLPGSSGTDVAEEPFGVPANLDLYGTMNTADRSIALLDIALRRRFDFQEMEPDYGVLSRTVGTVEVARMLQRINDRLEYLLDRDHRIGHAYLMNATSVVDLRQAFRLQIVPLLQEYFFDDLGRVALVLATAPEAPAFLKPERVVRGDLFPGAIDPSVPNERFRYTITDPESWTEASFTGLYSDGAGPTPQ